MSLNSGANPNVVKTALDDVFMQEFMPQLHPGWTTAESGAIFIQDSTDRAAEIEEVFKGVGLWGKRTEEEPVPQEDAGIDNKITFNVENFSKSMDIPKNFFDDNLHSSYEKMVRDFGKKAKLSQDDNAFSLYRGSFSGTLTADGVALVSDSHTTLGGDTVDNKLTAALSPDSLNDAIVAMMEQKDQAGVVSGNTPATLLVPPKLFKKASEITKSELLADTMDNNINVFSTAYGINIATSNRLGAAAGGSDTAWFLLSNNHAVRRWVRQGIETDLVDYRIQRNNNYIYKGEFREVVGAVDYVGVIGSTGLT